MNASDPLSSPDAARRRTPAGANDELLYRSDRTYVVRPRGPFHEASLVFKRAVGSEAVRRLRHERTMLQRLAGIEGVVRIAPGVWTEDTLALIDDVGVPLSAALEAGPADPAGEASPVPSLDPLDVALPFALQLARALAAVHRKGVLHGDLHPSNVLVAADADGGARPVLIDFNTATLSVDDRAGFVHEHLSAGTLAYMSPEQTGRTGRPVDQRSDLYALGAVLYRLFAGRPPFQTDDLLGVLRHLLTTVPPAPAVLRPGLPQALSDVVMRLLEKEPDRRYQSAEGVAHDLERLLLRWAAGDPSPIELGERDFAPRLLPPSRQIGRGREIGCLAAALDDARTSGICLIVEGGPGVGKTTLVNELRGQVSERNGWFITGRFDPHLPKAPGAIIQAMRELGRLLLSEPQAQLGAHRDRIRAAIGHRPMVGISQLPEFELLLGVQEPEHINPIEAQRSMFRNSMDILRCVASPEQPLVMAVDDLQWAPDSTVRFIDAVLSERERIPGFLFALALRTQDLPADGYLASALARWETLADPPRRLALRELDASQVGQLVEGMLRLPPDDALRFATALGERAHGNPQDTIELINALRSDGLLELRADGWHWDEQALVRYVGESDGIDLLARRVQRMPPACLALMDTLACLGAGVPADLLEQAANPALGGVQATLAPALDEGLVVLDIRSTPTFRFRNSRVQSCVYDGLDGTGRRVLRLAIARCLSHRGVYLPQAAQQYLDVLDDLQDAAERRKAAALMADAADASRRVNKKISERYVAGALRALTPVEQPGDAALMLRLLRHHHFLLYGLGRHEEADAAYEAIAARCADPFELAESAGVQLHSLVNRLRFPQAFALGLQVLEQLGLPRPADMTAVIASGLKALSVWAADPDKRVELLRPEVTDPRVTVLADFLVRVLAPAYYHDKAIYVWLMLECHRLWVAHGPCESLMSAVASLPLVLVSPLKNYKGAHDAAKHAIAVGEARGYEAGTARARIISAMCVTHWGGPLEQSLEQCRQARPGLVAAGDVHYNVHTYSASVWVLFEISRTLDDAAAEIEAAFAYNRECGQHGYDAVIATWRQTVRALRGETFALGSFDSADYDADTYLQLHAAVTVAPGTFHTLRALVALVFGNHAASHRHATQAIGSLSVTPGLYFDFLQHLCRGVAAAVQLRASAAPEPDASAPPAVPVDREALRAELEACRAWVAARAADAPVNFLHFAHLLDAEHAWALGQPWTAAAAFDSAMAEADTRNRPWHRAFILERAARFFFAHQRFQTGRPLLADAARAFQDWGADGKADALVNEFDFLRGTLPVRRRGQPLNQGAIASGDLVDFMAVLRASRALSSQTTLAQLNESLSDLLGSMCGADSVLLLMRPAQTDGWYLATSLEPGGQPVTVEQLGERGELPLSAFRYAERTREPLLLDDAVKDPRFASDPALTSAAHRSMLLVPILKLGELRALLVLQNRLRCGAFSAGRLDAVSMIAGQLAVSLDNVLLYASMERKVAERTAALEEANRQLEQLSITDPLTGMANRRRFTQMLQSEWQRALRTGSPIGLAMVDVDHFKLYNDHHGHPSGDAVLRRVAGTLADGLRLVGDLAARYGGEEFVLVLPNTDLAGTYSVCDRLRREIEALAEPHLQSAQGVITVSIGIVAFVPTNDATPAQYIEAADARLYEAKRRGRNRVWGRAEDLAGG